MYYKQDRWENFLHESMGVLTEKGCWSLLVCGLDLLSVWTCVAPLKALQSANLCERDVSVETAELH